MSEGASGVRGEGPGVKGKKVQIISLGCPKNQVDSEVMASLLEKGGFRLTERREDAAVILINTCAFILPAKEEAIEEILSAALWKKGAAGRRIVVAGCLPQRYGSELAESLPEVDLFLGISDVPEIDRRLKMLFAGEKGKNGCAVIGKPTFLMNAAHKRIISTPAGSAYLKIAEGCSNSCSYCVIPSIRGKARSRGIDDIIQEAEELASQGVRELILIAQDTTAYGRDLREKTSLSRLLRELAEIDGISWIRLLYLYPGRITPELLRTIAEGKKICKYIDIPIQHSDDSILAAMRRGGNSAQLRSVIARAREIIPGVALRTSLIVGFPGETPRRFENLLSFVREIRFDHLGAFPYCREEGSKAASLPVRISELEKQRRRDILMEEQAFISREINTRLIGSVQEVLVEGKSERDDFPMTGRCRRQAPEIDGITYLKGGNAKIGQIFSCRITASDDYDLFAEIIA
ncbi:MAG: 30S ribosomal protein S12 methylthiotransferase RimO [Syntrophales bacterium]|nr:30S ribosomal protein S12 methylthiotransferase RimO [Syntrophales bacterium]